MKTIKKKGIICFLVLFLSSFSVVAGVSVTIPTQDGGAIHFGDKEWKRHHRHGDESRRVCKEVTREKCKKKCHWSEFHQEERCRTFCRPVTEERCYRKDY